MQAIELFAGAGGLSLGAKNAGIDCFLAIEKDRAAAATYAKNFPNAIVLNKDICQIEFPDIEAHGRPDIVLAGPPCQAFSTSNQRTRNDANPQNALLLEVIRFVEYFQPLYCIVENVNGLSIGTRKIHLNKLLESFSNIGYYTQVVTAVGTDLGLPQRRTRLFIIASRNPLNAVVLPTRNDAGLITVKDAIFDLPKLQNGDQLDFGPYACVAQSDYASMLRGGLYATDGHIVSDNNPSVIHRYSYISQGGNWKSIPRSLLMNYQDVERCHTGIYHRLSWDNPAKVLGNFRKNMLIHPNQDRGLSVREAARLQSFPDWFGFCGSIGKKQQQVGNAVPPLMATAVIASVLGAEGLNRRAA